MREEEGRLVGVPAERRSAFLPMTGGCPFASHEAVGEASEVLRDLRLLLGDAACGDLDFTLSSFEL